MKLIRVIFGICFLGILGTSFAQTPNYQYSREIKFQQSDSLANPYLVTVDSQNTLWVISSTATDTNTVNALYKASPGDTVMTLVKLYTPADSVRSLSGLASVGTDIFVVSRIASDEFYYPYSQMKYYPDGNVSQEQTFRAPNDHDYGSWLSGLDATSDGYLFTGRSYLVTIVSFDGRSSSDNLGQTVGASVNSEPGGGLTYPNVIDLIRDVAVDPGGDYTVSGAPVYTSRNSSPEGDVMTGGIAVWTGGTETSPGNFTATRVTDADGFLAWEYSAPYGITVQPQTGYLFACGTDSSRRWVKGFEVSGSFATQMDELPSSTSKDEITVDPEGAPFMNPSDVAFTSDGNTAYVSDEGTNSIFVFSKIGTGVGDEHLTNIPTHVELEQNYPNPFNPTTNITFQIPSKSSVRIAIYDTRGHFIRNVANQEYSAGEHHVTFDGSHLPSGIYFCKITAGNQTDQIKMLLLK